MPTALSPFRIVSFRFQWPSDLLTSWAFEMETLILGWYILVATDSVLWLAVFGSLQFLGTLIAPAFGVGSDRIGRRSMLCSMRAAYVALAATIMFLSLSGLLTPFFVFAVAICSGLIRPSDLVMRNALIADTIPAEQLLKAMSISRTTMDSARIAGALMGAGLFSELGIGLAYLAVTIIYAVSLVLTLGVAKPTPAKPGSSDAPTSALKDLIAGIRYVQRTPTVFAIMWLAFLINLTAYPVALGLLPYVAREVLLTDENGLGHVVAAYSSGALLGSVYIILSSGWRRPGKLMLCGTWGWYALLFVFGFITDKIVAMILLSAVGVMQSIAMVSMSVVLLRVTDPEFRGRVLGVRMLAVYGLPVGLLVGGPVITQFGFTGMVSIYCLVGFVASLLVTLIWRRVLWYA